MRERAYLIIGLLVIGGILALIFRDQLAEVSGLELASVAMGLMALAIVGGGAMAGREMSRNWFTQALLWVAILLGLSLLYFAVAPYLPAGFGTR
jgi:Mg2+/citrate symporter